MARQHPTFTVQERPGRRYTSLEEAQRRALAPLASQLTGLLQQMLAEGTLELQEGRLVAPAGSPARKGEVSERFRAAS